jgi:DNA-binding LytR/AlgR family response regulator
MRIGICDDNVFEQQKLEKYCKNIGETDTFLFSSGEQLFQNIDCLDLLFLDIEMKNMDGIRVKELLENQGNKTLIIFYTCHSEMMQKAFGINVIGFLRKPVTEHEVRNLLERACLQYRRNYTITLGEEQNIGIDEVLYIHSEMGYTTVHTIDNREYLARKRIHEWIDELEAFAFCNIHRSYIVNLKYVEKLEGKNIILQGKKIAISRRKFQKVKEEYIKYKNKI